MNIKRLSIGIPLAIILYFTLPWTLISLFGVLSPTPPKPKNTYGEFPFRLVYEVDGEQFTVDDVLICEFTGRGGYDGSGNKILSWDMRLLSGNKIKRFWGYSGLTGSREWPTHAVIELLDGVVVQNSMGQSYMGSIDCDIGLPQYYLGYNTLEGYNPGIVFRSEEDIIGDDDLWSRYQIKIIEASFSQPMVGNGIRIKT